MQAAHSEIIYWIFMEMSLSSFIDLMLVVVTNRISKLALSVRVLSIIDMVNMIKYPNRIESCKDELLFVLRSVFYRWCL